MPNMNWCKKEGYSGFLTQWPSQAQSVPKGDAALTFPAHWLDYSLPDPKSYKTQ
jgi:hypothetical protein